ncbi:uncharacterized protein LOC130739928 [Lotus japonicus]|uniref:uncharacterized protein LOC130739928 n=1 Tax=Lotus japonicus TaxID=34305 RepID=UPI00258EFB5E|nr:uncharacterized protein LOC130739928 [Lotus japonicus]
MRMKSPNSPFFLPLLFFFSAISLLHQASFRVSGHQTKETQHGNGFGRRVLMSFKEKHKGSNLTFECAPSGPCVPCLYSEKGDEKYRCSETGYRIPFKCEEIKDSKKDAEKKNPQKTRSSLEVSNSTKPHKVSHVAGGFTISQSHRSLLDNSSPSDNKSQAYVTYRSCIPAVTEEKLTLLRFEGIMVILLIISGSIIYLRKKMAASASGYVAVRTQTKSRF